MIPATSGSNTRRPIEIPGKILIFKKGVIEEKADLIKSNTLDEPFIYPECPLVPVKELKILR